MKRIALLGILVLSAAIALTLRLQSSNLYINGKLASTGIVEKNGVAYVPIKDVAATLLLTVQKTARGYELSASGGANQVEGVTGKIGDMLFNGFVRFQVVKLDHVGKTYTRIYSGDSSVMNVIPEAYEFVVVTCKFKNALQKAIAPNYVGGDTTALTDTEGHSFPARRFSDCPPIGDLLPGAAVDFALVFDVPPGAKLQDLVYEPQAMMAPGIEKKKFRISLAHPD